LYTNPEFNPEREEGPFNRRKVTKPVLPSIPDLRLKPETPGRAEDAASAIRTEERRRSQESVEALGFDERMRLTAGEEMRRRRARSDERAETEALGLARNSGTFPQLPIVANPVTGEPMLQIRNPADFADAAVVEGSYVDPRSGAPVETFEPAVAIAGSNTPTSAQMLNAPPTQSATEFVAKLVGEGTRTTQNSVMPPQVAINATLQTLDDRIRNFAARKSMAGLSEQVPSQINSLDDFQKASDAILRVAAQNRYGLGRQLPEGGRSTANLL